MWQRSGCTTVATYWDRGGAARPACVLVGVGWVRGAQQQCRCNYGHAPMCATTVLHTQRRGNAAASLRCRRCAGGADSVGSRYAGRLLPLQRHVRARRRRRGCRFACTRGWRAARAGDVCRGRGGCAGGWMTRGGNRMEQSSQRTSGVRPAPPSGSGVQQQTLRG